MKLILLGHIPLYVYAALMSRTDCGFLFFLFYEIVKRHPAHTELLSKIILIPIEKYGSALCPFQWLKNLKCSKFDRSPQFAMPVYK